MRLTIACPQSLISDANQLAMILGYGSDDSVTYDTEIEWVDTKGNLYACASLIVSQLFVSAASVQLQRPEWDVNLTIDLEAASRAQAAINLYYPLPGTKVPKADPNKLLAIAFIDPIYALSLAELSKKPKL